MLQGRPIRVTCTRYPQLGDRARKPAECLNISAWTDDGEIMGVRHQSLPLEGVQFQPEALLTEHGHEMLNNFLIEFKSFQAAF